ncbi:hypothetical protein VFPPC_16625 [Pochonia chlamydosporia 170]|uniref:Uncharacterized protein n=1 Tax=Pochonia chlamydosporia 170 TaxID=1380566 RepID=A0A179F9T7_METCM|nr:hypothetical protein VFPPC_16625 [Pochonia chlamydosporia 170]OAQ62208.1 hypothetical protein VFPPC_16625 [Pochonia chlamydosporia 170]
MPRIIRIVLASLAFAMSTLGRVPPTPAAASASASDCTTTMTITASPLPTPPFWPQCSFDGTERIYSSTVTMNHAIDCHGCRYVQLIEQFALNLRRARMPSAEEEEEGGGGGTVYEEHERLLFSHDK